MVLVLQASPLASRSLLASPFSPPALPSATGGEEKKKEERERGGGSGSGALAGRQTRSAAGAAGSPGRVDAARAFWAVGHVRAVSNVQAGVCAGAGRHALLCQKAWAGRRRARPLRLPACSPHQLASSGAGDGRLTAHPRPPPRAQSAPTGTAPAPRAARATTHTPSGPSGPATGRCHPGDHVSKQAGVLFCHTSPPAIFDPRKRNGDLLCP